MERSRYEKEQERIWNVILSSINVKGSQVIDVGIGKSTKKLAEAGADVIGVDRDLEKLQDCALEIPLIKCDITNFPFKKQVADFTMFHFTLHEMDPRNHVEAIHIASVISPKLLVIEASPKGGSTYQRFRSLWQKAMESIGRYEEVRPFSYWKDLVRRGSFTITTAKKIEQKAEIPPSVLEKILRETITTWRGWDVQKQYIEDMKELLVDAKEQGMYWSPLSVIIGKR